MLNINENLLHLFPSKGVARTLRHGADKNAAGAIIGVHTRMARRQLYGLRGLRSARRRPRARPALGICWLTGAEMQAPGFFQLPTSSVAKFRATREKWWVAAMDGGAFVLMRDGSMEAWVDRELCGGDLGDRRLNRRLGKLMEDLSQRVGKGIPLYGRTTNIFSGGDGTAVLVGDLPGGP